MEWYSFRPQDTLYFRGAEPAIMGESHAASLIFPPPAHTIAGALRTAVLRQHNIDPTLYNQGKCPPDKDEVLSVIGPSGMPSPFDVIGPFFFSEEKLWVPCPFHWFAEKEQLEDMGNTPLKITFAKPVANSLVSSRSGGGLFWAKGKEMKSLGGCWVSLEDVLNDSDAKTIKEGKDFFTSEIRTGIALNVKETRRTVRQSHLYCFVHARLHSGVVIAFGVSGSLPLSADGILTLGAEQRFGEYKKNTTAPKFSKGKSGLYMTLSILAADAQANAHCVATGRILYYGGWDLHRGFHKPMKGYFPAGSVFDRQIKPNCIQI
ncbi:MAG TPA: type III-B CRISPR module-associated Cmr3 family protein [Syntrophales bacterium]|jgi:CRISPR-associated protein Cmr3|nr:type III-B CRISPR module-associated Cmr3 family protein [Syntrophales bacterium]HOO40235.1 type III-B CRISPR module-associated Cmr3 family protein [Syntrophales bacterium]HPC33699.1 type III-B CRISPR module-associated Cmr3 family protein [Syntrophales bacterium]HQG34146.1 type III-B CRISPR module-associated Cmr3 family protein [Syntrophales bacterium]